MRPIVLVLVLILGLSCHTGLSVGQAYESGPTDSKEQLQSQREDAQRQVALARIDLAMWEERAAWSERLAKRGCGRAQAVADQALLMRAKAVLEKAERELNGLTPAAEQKAKAPKPAGSIQVVVKGTLGCKGIGVAYVSVRGSDGEETQIWFWLSEGEWKHFRAVLPPLDRQEVTVRGRICQLPENARTSIPNQALYFTSFEIETKAGEKIRP